MHIRSYTDLDLDGVLGCFRRSVHGLGARYYTAEQVAVWAPAALDVEAWRERLRTGCTLIAEIEGALAGFVRVEANGYVDLIYVDPAFARRGVGRALLERACAWAVGQGAARLTSDVSIAARPLFEAMGFRVEAEQQVERRGVLLTNFRMFREG